MKMSKLLTLIAVVMVLVLAFTACGPKDQPNAEHKCESACETCGKCTDASCTEDACKGKCEGHDPAPVETTPSISVVPPAIEIHAGDEIDLMFGVTVTDEGDDAPTLIIEDDDGFDAEVVGTYTITYKAQNKYGKTATATRTVTVLEALSALSLEVRANRLGENKWAGNILSFKNNEFVTITANYVSDVAISGVFYNASESELTVSITGQYGVAAIIDANGFVLEGRDGANGKLVNQANPDRTASSVSTIQVGDESVSVVSAFAKNLVVPAGGYAIVVQNGYCGTTVDTDGRGFMNYNVIYQYGNVVRLVWADSAEVLTPYVDQAPVITGHGNKVLANYTDAEFVLADAIAAGLTVTDDNGTFDPSDDVKLTVSVSDNGGFDINTVGSYTVTITATDGTLTTTVTRVVDVVDNLVSVKVNDKAFSLLPDKIAIDEDLSKIGSYLFVVYTPEYTGTLNWTDGWGEAFILNQYGQVIRIYDGANGKYYDADNKSGVVDATKCTAKGYLTEAFASRQEGEYMIVAPNGATGQLTRAFFLSNRTIGAQLTIPGITFPNAPHTCESKCDKCGKCLDAECTESVCAEKCEGHAHECESVCATCGKCQDAECTETVCAEKCACHECESVCEHCGGCTDAECTQAACATKCPGHVGSMFVTIGSKKYEALSGKWAINETITTSTAANKAVWVFTKDYTGEFSTNGYGAAVILDQFGRVLRIYDGANAGYTDADSGVNNKDHGVTTGNYATLAWESLQAGEYLVVLPNGGSTDNEARKLGLDCRWLIGQKMNLTGVEFASTTMTITIGSKTYTAELGKWAVNETITTNTAANKAIWVFTKDYTGEFSTNGYGAAVILDQFGRVLRIYDGANAGYTDADSGVNNKDHGVTTGNYATLAWESLQAGEYLVVLPNGGSTDNEARKLGLDCRWLIGQKMNLTGVEFASTTMTITIGSKTYTAELGKWAVNETITTNTAANKAIWVFTKDYTGEFSTNGYGCAVILDAEGKVLRIYDGANAGYTDKDSGVNNKDHGVTTDNYATLAWESLQEGETLVVLPNGGSTDNAARKVGLDCRWLIGQKMTITNVDFAG